MIGGNISLLNKTNHFVKGNFVTGLLHLNYHCTVLFDAQLCLSKSSSDQTTAIVAPVLTSFSACC